MTGKARPSNLLKLAVMQFVCTLIFSVVLYFSFDAREALSAFFGGVIAVFSSLLFAWQLYRGGHNLEPHAMLVRFYVSVVLKLILSLAMMAVFIIVIKVSLLPFIVAYLLGALIVNWLYFWLVQTPENAGSIDIKRS